MMAGKEQNVVLPPELWKEILLKLWQSEEDLKDVLTCRKVCRSWEELVDKMPPNPYWNPWLSYPEYRNREDDIFQVHPATSFTQDSDVSNFLLELPTIGSDDGRKIPFRNQTVRLFQYNQYNQLHKNDVKNEEENLLMLLREHGHHIRKLLWNPHDELPERLVNLPLLLSTLTNLRILIIDSLGLSNENKKIIRGEDFPKELKHLRELLFKCHFSGLSGGDPDNTLYGKLSVNYGNQIKSITFSSFLYLDISKKNVLDCYPNLEDLKVCYLDQVCWYCLTQPSGNPWPKLLRLALNSCSYEGDVGFINVLDFVCCFSETLELLSLRFELSNKKIDWQNANNNPTVFPKLEKLILPISIVYNERLRQPINIPIERRLNFRFPALKSVVLEDDVSYQEEEEALRNANPIGTCETLWPFVPSSVETISIRDSWRLDTRIGQEAAHTYKCSRNPTN